MVLWFGVKRKYHNIVNMFTFQGFVFPLKKKKTFLTMKSTIILSDALLVIVWTKPSSWWTVCFCSCVLISPNCWFLSCKGHHTTAVTSFVENNSVYSTKNLVYPLVHPQIYSLLARKLESQFVAPVLPNCVQGDVMTCHENRRELY